MTTPPGKLRLSPPSLGTQTAVFPHAAQVRTEVFIKEQKIPEGNEYDLEDDRCWHWVCYVNEEPVGVIRLVPPPHLKHESEEGPDQDMAPTGSYVKLGRLAVLKKYRGMGVAKKLVKSAVDWACAGGLGLKDGDKVGGDGWDGRIFVHAQVNIEDAWKKMGFTRSESMGTWYEEGMLLSFSV
jgi:predicted GNAT family N-acyltransferase